MTWSDLYFRQYSLAEYRKCTADGANLGSRETREEAVVIWLRDDNSWTTAVVEMDRHR